MRTLTQCLVIALTVALIAYDIVIYKTVGSDATISRVILPWAYRYQLLPFAAGIVTAHLFMPSHRMRDRLLRFTGIGYASVVMLLADLGIESVHPGWALVAGLVVGRYLWPQPRPSR